MKLINPSYEIIIQKPGLQGIYEQIELAGRTCYQSSHNIKYDEEGNSITAKDFVDRMIKSGHTAMLEHGTVYLQIPTKKYEGIDKYSLGPYSKAWYHITGKDEGIVNVTTNYRVIVENNLFDYLKYLCEPTEYHEKRYTVDFITSIGIGRELLRHRVIQEDYEPEPLFSYANESTRFCNYNKDKFNNELTFIIPNWAPSLQEGVLQYSPFEITDREVIFMNNCHRTETDYLAMITGGATPEDARDILPLCTKSELVMTGFISDWEKVFDLRVKGTTGRPHPDVIKLLEPVMNEFINKGYINEESN